MNDGFTFDVVISGMENIPLRTNAEGAKALMNAFDKGDKACDILLKAMSSGIEYHNNLVTIKQAEDGKQQPRTREKPAGLQTGRKPTRKPSRKN